MRRVMLIGEAPGRTPGLPFEGRCGTFLYRLAGVHPRKAFECRNVLAGYPGPCGCGADFPLAEARQEAAGIVLDGVALLCGKRVAAAFGVQPIYFLRQQVGTAEVYVIPHPSGVNRWYNSLSNRRRAARFLRRFV